MATFDALSDLDFEELTADLMRAQHNLAFRTGTRGADAGIDVLAIDSSGGRHVVQCKHYRTSTYSDLKRAARREADGLAERATRFATYRFATSRRLTHRQREEIASILHPWITTVDDVLGESDLQALLRDHPEVEQHHVKLWLASAGALRRALSARSYQRSAALLRDIQDRVTRYVQTSDFHRARALLERKSVCVIAGPPGIGKTTLARLLLLDGLESGFQPYEIVRGALSDAWDLLDLDEPQIFLFDDFLGQTFLDEGRESDADVLRFVREVARRRNRRLVMATREYILREARQLSEVLNRESDPAHHYLLELPKLTREDRARILYNHVWCSDEVDDVARRTLLHQRGYLQVIDHAAFNPRVIEWICGLGVHRLTDEQRRNFTHFCLGALDHPHDLWTHAFERGLGPAERALLLPLPGLPARLSQTVLEQAFDASCAARRVDMHGGRFMKALEVVEDSFLSAQRVNGEIWLSADNPSLLDFLGSQILQSVHDARAAIAGAAFFEQVAWLFDATLDARLNRDVLARDFAAAFDRTFAAPALGSISLNSIEERARRENLESEQDRLAAMLTRFERSQPLRDASADWFSRRARKWLDGLTVWELSHPTALPIAKRLIAIDAIAPDEVGRAVLNVIGTNPHRSPLLEFGLLVDALDVAPAVIRPQLDAERPQFIRFVDEAFKILGEHIDDEHDLSTFEYVAEAMGVELPTDEVASAYEWIQEREEEADRQREDQDPDDYDYHDWPRAGDDGEHAHDADADIDAMFGRFDD